MALTEAQQQLLSGLQAEHKRIVEQLLLVNQRVNHIVKEREELYHQKTMIEKTMDGLTRESL